MSNNERWKAVPDKSKCAGCGICVTVCPVDAITLVDGKAEISDACIACGACVSVCPNEAIELKMTVSEVKDK